MNKYNRIELLLIAVFTTILFDTYTCYSFQDKINTYKAVFIERFIRFIDWPSALNIDNPKTPIIISVIGNSEILGELKKIATLQSTRTIEIRNIYNFSQANNSHIIFISEDKISELEKNINTIKKAGTLIISDFPNATNYGVHINFFIENNKLRFEINEKAVFEAGFNISYLLLKSAKVVNPRK